MLKDWQLYLIVEMGFVGGRDVIEVVRAAASGGADVVQLRDKTSSSREFFHRAARIREITRKAGIDFIVNDRADIAFACGADGLHLGAKDLPLTEARRILGKRRLIGLSTHSLAEVEEAAETGADYLSFGPVYPTPLKPGKPAVGVKLLKEAVRLARVPLVAVGGINSDNIEEVRETGVRTVAVIRAVLEKEDITAACRKLVSGLDIGQIR